MTTKRTPSVTGHVVTRQERQLAAAHWLLSAAPSVPQALAEWREVGAAWLRPGVLFGAVLVRAGLLHSVMGATGPEECAAPLAQAIGDGPVFYQHDACGLEAGYTVLLPAGTVRVWEMPGTVVHKPRALLLVPAPFRHTRADAGPWWIVPPDGPGLLCPRALLVPLLGRGAGHA